MKHQAIVGWLTALSMLALSALPAWGGPLPQTDTRTYRKPEWALTVTYPASWEVEQAAADVIALSSDPAKSDGVSGVCLITRSPTYANPDYALEEMFQDVMDQIKGTADDFTSAPAHTRPISGIAADVASFTSVNSSKVKLEGSIYRVIKGRYAYGIIVASPATAWERYRSYFDALLDSIQLGAARPGQTPTPTPHPPLSTPTPKPTLHPRLSTPTPKPTPRAAGFTSAHEAYDVAWPDVEPWSPDAVLGEAFCTDANLLGKCREWDLTFMASPDADIIDADYEVVVSGGQIDTAQGGEDYFFLADGLGTDWIDSTEAMQVFLDNGGRQFLDENPEAEINDFTLFSSVDGSPMWTIRAKWSAGGAEFSRDIDATTGALWQST